MSFSRFPRFLSIRVRPAAIGVLSVLAVLALGGCSIRGLAINALANSLAASGDVFASDEDPELVRDAIPFALKTMESLLAEKPDHGGLLLSTCKGFTQYSYAFVESPSKEVEFEDYTRSRELGERALKLYLRARDYCWRALELRSAGVIERLKQGATDSLSEFGASDVELLYWSGAAWGATVSAGRDRPEIAVDLPAVSLLIARALELDESYDRGAVHEVMISLEALPESMGGSRERARDHFTRAVELAGGLKARPYVSLAESVSVAEQNRPEFVELLHKALAVDPGQEPSYRLVNLIVQQRAKSLLEQVDEYFFLE